jgi:hypothetical protein
MTGQRGEETAVDPGGGPIELAETGGRVRAALEEIFGRITPIAAAFAAQRHACLAARTELTPDRLTGVRETVWHQLGLLPAADGAGIVAAPGVVAGRERHLEWWQRTASGADTADGYSRIRLNLDPESIDLYDYLDMDWFTVPRAEGRRYVYGPYIDFSGADRSILALTIPVLDPADRETSGSVSAASESRGGGAVEGNGGVSRAGESGTRSGVSKTGESRGAAGRADESSGSVSAAGEFLGVAGADIRMSHLEPVLLAILRALPAPAVLVTAERRVLAANSPRWIPAVTEIGADSGWLLAAATPHP